MSWQSASMAPSRPGANGTSPQRSGTRCRNVRQSAGGKFHASRSDSTERSSPLRRCNSYSRAPHHFRPSDRYRGAARAAVPAAPAGGALAAAANSCCAHPTRCSRSLSAILSGRGCPPPRSAYTAGLVGGMRGSAALPLGALPARRANTTATNDAQRPENPAVIVSQDRL